MDGFEHVLRHVSCVLHCMACMMDTDFSWWIFVFIQNG